MIELTNVSYQYPEAAAPSLDNVSLSIHKGEIVAICGHNGSGKSTLAKHFNALLLPTDGTVAIDGLDTHDERNTLEIRRRVGMVFQNPDNQLVTTIVEEDVGFGPENLGIAPAEIRRRVDAALDAVNMKDFAQNASYALSGGQKQRIAIAGMLAMQPEVLVLDEATAMLDPRGREEVLSTVRRLNQELGMTVIMITQYMEETVDCDRVLIMSGGKLILDAAPETAFADTALLRECGLAAPAFIRLRESLVAAGMPIQGNPMHCEELCEAICQSLLNN